MESSYEQESPVICLSESTLTPTVQEDAAVPSVREQVHHGPQLPPDQLGANISEVSAEVRWSQFWSDIKKEETKYTRSRR